MVNQIFIYYLLLDVDPRRDDDASPMSSYISDVIVLVKNFPSMYQVKIQFRTFLEKIQIFGFLCCSTREALSIDVSIGRSYMAFLTFRALDGIADGRAGWEGRK